MSGPHRLKDPQLAEWFDQLDELLVEVRLPYWPAGRRWGFEEFARRRGDFALAGVAVYYDLDASGVAINAHVGMIGVADRPMRFTKRSTVGLASLSGSNPRDV